MYSDNTADRPNNLIYTNCRLLILIKLNKGTNKGIQIGNKS